MTDATPLPFRCRCGTVSGTLSDVSPRAGLRAFCYCTSCRAFALHLGQGELLDAAGGTELFQTAPGRLTFETGSEQLRCLRMTPGGVLRWYTACCRTPIANTPPSPGQPFMGFFVGDLRDAAPGALDAALGPVRYRVNGRDATGTPPKGTLKTTSLGHLLRIGAIILRARRTDRGASPFFSEAGTPVATVAPVERVPPATAT